MHCGGSALQVPSPPQVRTASPTRKYPELHEKFAIAPTDIEFTVTAPFAGGLKSVHLISVQKIDNKTSEFWLIQLGE